MREVSGQRPDGDRGQPEDVRTRLRRVAGQHFWRGHSGGLGRLSGAERAGSEVGEHGSAVGGEQHVRGCDVTMHQTPGMELGQRLRDRRAGGHDLTRGQRPSTCQQVVQAAAVGVLQHENQRSRDVHDSEQRQDVRVVDGCQQRNLAARSLPCGGIFQRQEPQCDPVPGDVLAPGPHGPVGAKWPIDGVARHVRGELHPPIVANAAPPDDAGCERLPSNSDA